jgi:hypothetical protein
MVPPRDQLPKSWKGLKNYTFILPKLFLNVPWTCPRSKNDIFKYLNVEAPGGSEAGSENVINFDLKFVRTAKVNRSKYWLWSFIDERGTDCFVAVQKNEAGQNILGYDESFGLTPEQWLIMDYYDDWENKE